MSKKYIRKFDIKIQSLSNNKHEFIFDVTPNAFIQKQMNTKAILLSFWDSENQESLKMDLWVKDMPVDQMQLFFHQTLVSLSDTFYRATQDEKMTSTMRDFCDYFAEKLELKKP